MTSPGPWSSPQNPHKSGCGGDGSPRKTDQLAVYLGEAHTPALMRNSERLGVRPLCRAERARPAGLRSGCQWPPALGRQGLAQDLRSVADGAFVQGNAD